MDLNILCFFSPFFCSAELWPHVLITGKQISSTNAQIKTWSPLKTQRASHANKCENLFGLYNIFAQRMESLQGQETGRCHESSAGETGKISARIGREINARIGREATN